MKVNLINSPAIQARIDALQAKGWAFSITDALETGECVARRPGTEKDNAEEVVTALSVITKTADSILNAATAAALEVCANAEQWDTEHA